MPDLDLDWQGDFSLTPAGDIALVDGDDLTRQRIERRLFTAVRGYLWHADYGAGLPQKIGGIYTPQAIQALVRAQIGLESSVAPSPPPVITVSTDTNSPGLQVISITYTDAPSGEQVGLTITL